MTDQELKNLVASLAIKSDKLTEQMKQTDIQMKQTDIQMKQTDVQMKKTDVQMKKTDEKLNKIGVMVGSMGNNQGDVAEEFFYNSLSDDLCLNGIKFDFLEKNVTRKKGSVEDEYDLLLVNGKDVFIIEVKYKAHEKDLNRLLNKKYPNFKKLYPEYKNYTHHLGLASFCVNDELKDKAMEEGVTLLQRRGTIIETIAA